MTPEEALKTIQMRDYNEAFHGYFSIPTQVIWNEIISLRKEKEFLRLSLESAARQVKSAQDLTNEVKKSLGIVQDQNKKLSSLVHDLKNPVCSVCGSGDIVIYICKSVLDEDGFRVDTLREGLCDSCVTWTLDYADKPKKHVCQQSRSCICNSQALEPDDHCPVHGFPFPPRCGECGRFMKWLR